MTAEKLFSDEDERKAVVERLRATLSDADRRKGFETGAKWAKEQATAAELEGAAAVWREVASDVPPPETGPRRLLSRPSDPTAS